MSSLKVFICLTVVTLSGFILTAVYTENIIASFIAGLISQIIAASIISRIDFGRWNPFV